MKGAATSAEVICVTPNPALDRTLEVPHLRPGAMMRATSARVAAGGKGVNVARALSTLGVEARCMGPLGGASGRILADLAAADGLNAAWTWCEAETRSCVILVDSGGSDEVGRHIATAVRRITDKPVTHVVNTHHHGDHYFGNVAFEGATFISSEMCRKMVLETSHEWLEIMERDIGRKLPGTKPLAAGVTYPEGTRTETFIHGVRVVFLVPRGSHTIGDLLVHLPDDKVLVAGDILVSGVVPTFQDGFLKNWIRTLDEIQTLGVAHFVPGHGDLMTLHDVIALRDAMLQFYSGVKEGFRNGQSEGEIRKSLDISSWDKLERSYVIGRNINRAYLEIERESFNE